MTKKSLRKEPLKIIILCVLCLGSLFYLKSSVQPVIFDGGERKFPVRHYHGYIKHDGEQLALTGRQFCQVPVLDVNASEILKLLKDFPKVVCDAKKDWVEVNGSTLKVKNWVKKTYGKVKCFFTEVIRDNDNKQHNGKTKKSSTEYKLEKTDVVWVHCNSKRKKRWLQFNKLFMGIRSDKEIFDRTGWSKLPNDSLKLNVLMFGFDSLSHNMWKRKLPKAYDYATKYLKGIALNGYNIVGDGTPQALIPILTGKTELELPDTRKRMWSANYVNVYPFIWNDFQNNGYVTAWSEDLAQVGTFNHRLKGFNEQPVDHYMRPYFLESNWLLEKEQPFCFGELSRFRIMLDFVRNVYEVYKTRPKFVFAFHSEYTHGDNISVANADDELTEWLQEFHEKGYLNDTLLILMSDHGSRFDSIRNTQQGKMEERLPGFIFVFPSWFEKKYPEAHKNFKINADRLTTPFDIHETLADVLHFQETGMGDIRNRGISLFKEVPLTRTCQDAAIEPHWCTCLDWEIIPTSDSVVADAAVHLLQFLNGYTQSQRHLCHELSLNKILSSVRLLPRVDVLKFRRTSEDDGFVGDLSGNTAISVEIYQLKVSLNPGDMIFEASIRYYLQDDKFLVLESEISRINRYRHMTHCIEDADILHHLRKFCNCRL